MLFSERKGIKPIKNVMQVDSMDEDIKNGLWSGLVIYYFQKIQSPPGIYATYPISYTYNTDFHQLFGALWLHYFKKPIDTLPDMWPEIEREIRKYYFECQWYEVYDFIEFIADNFPDKETNGDFMKYCNRILEREVSAYRFVGGKVTQITTPEEIKEIEDSLKVSISPVQTHLRQSLELLSDRKKPDYRNSIKEAVSSVESLCKLITKDDKATLGQALKQIEDRINLHPALKTAFSNLYGYTNDEKGIRHALLEESKIEFEDAKFMLVSCSAFVNYLTTKLSRARIKL